VGSARVALLGAIETHLALVADEARGVGTERDGESAPGRGVTADGGEGFEEGEW